MYNKFRNFLVNHWKMVALSVLALAVAVICVFFPPAIIVVSIFGLASSAALSVPAATAVVATAAAVATVILGVVLNAGLVQAFAWINSKYNKASNGKSLFLPASIVSQPVDSERTSYVAVVPGLAGSAPNVTSPVFPASRSIPVVPAVSLDIDEIIDGEEPALGFDEVTTVPLVALQRTDALARLLAASYDPRFLSSTSAHRESSHARQVDNSPFY